MMHLFPSFKRFCLILLCGIYCNYPFVPSNRTSLSCIFMKLTNIQCLECTLSSHQSLLTSRRPRDTTRAKINKHQFVNNPAQKMLFHSPELSLQLSRTRPGPAAGINSSSAPHTADYSLPATKQGAGIHLSQGNGMGRTSPDGPDLSQR